MSLTPSTMLALGTTAPPFSLTAADGTVYDLEKRLITAGLLVIFMCNHCPYVIHIRQTLVEKLRDYQERGIEVVAINSNDFLAYPDDNPEKMAEIANEFNFTFPFLVDETQEVAKAYQAACTPDFFLFDGNKKLVYRGQFDSARPGKNTPVTGVDLTDSINRLIAGQPISEIQRPSMGCNIKWKSGKEPHYFNK